MYTDLAKEKEFYSKKFSFSYSSLSKLLYAPSLFYKDYILLNREEKLGKHLIEGKLIHCLLFEPKQLTSKFNIVPGKVPPDSVKSVLNLLKDLTKEKDIRINNPELKTAILSALKTADLYQAFVDDKKTGETGNQKRLNKIQTDDNQVYWEFINNSSVDVVDNEMLERCKAQVEILKDHKDVQELFENIQTDFPLDPVQSYAEKLLTTALENKPFDIKGILDYYKVNSETKSVVICDLKTTSSTITQFAESVERYNYWLQAAMYYKLVLSNLTLEEQTYNIVFKFVVIDKYNQVYVFSVSDETMMQWGERLLDTLNQAEYHYINKDYSLPFHYLTNIITL
jgi:hypothetical protein